MLFNVKVNAQIYSWNPNVGSCVTPTCLTNPYSASSVCMNSNGITLNHGLDEVTILQNACYWYGARYYPDCNSCPITLHYEVDLYSNYAGQNLDSHKFVALGNYEHVVSSWTNGADITNYGGNSLFFNFPIANQKRNFFYQVGVSGSGSNTTQTNDLLGVAINQITNINSTLWDENMYIDGPIKNKIVQSVLARSIENSRHNFDVYISEESNGIVTSDSGVNSGTDSYDTQIGIQLIPLNAGKSQAEPVAGTGGIFILEDVAFDCDHDNIVFRASIEQPELNGHSSCTQPVYKVRLHTDCPNINFNDYPYSIFVGDGNGNTRSFIGNGETTMIDINDLPAGNYNLQIVYNTDTGKNIKVKEQFLETEFNFYHDPVNLFRINSTYIIDKPTWVPKDIVIESGGTLIVRNSMNFKELTSINVNPGGILELENSGHLTSCDAHWLGVFVRYNGIVNAHGTISNSYYGIHNDDKLAAVINCDGAQFIDNRAGITAWYDAIVTVRNSQFIGGVYGASLFECTGGTTPNGVLFEGNTFSYQTDAGIASNNSRINVQNGNQFIGCNEGIAMRNLFGSNSESLIGSSGNSNVFSNCGIGVYANANTQTLQNNVFSNCNNGTFMSGVNGYESYTNTFIGGYNAEGLFSAGAESNISERNDHSGSVYGIRTYFDNDNYTFLANCFYSAGTDVESYGTISGSQGDGGVAASNCFTQSNFVEDFVCNTNDVLYYVPKPTVSYPPCLVPATPGTYSVEHESDLDGSGSCGSTLGNPPVGEYDYIKVLGCDSVRIHKLIAEYRAKLIKFQTSNKPLTRDERATIAWLTRHLRYLVNQWAWCLRKQGRKPELYVWYKAQEGKDYAIKAAEVQVSMQQYSLAIAELQEIQTKYAVDKPIIDAMILNIGYVRTDVVPSLTSSAQINLLRSVAAMSDPYAAYGRALLYKLTGEKIEPLLPEIAQRSRNNDNGVVKEIYTITPNPSSDFIKISIENAFENDSYDYEILDMTGNKVNAGSLSTQSSIDVSKVPSGIYFVQIMKNHIPDTIQKIVILK